MLKEILQYDVDGKLKDSLRDMGWYISPKTGRWTHIGGVAVAGIDPDSPWIFPNHDPSQRCKLYQAIVIKCNLIPAPCLNCWKVVVHPKTLLELMEVLNWQKIFVNSPEGAKRYCKAGIEHRKYVPHNYGAYFYCVGRDKGLRRKAQVREAMDRINPEIPVVLKRYCTEFELKLGPSNKYKATAGMNRLEKKIFERIDVDSAFDQPGQPEDVQKSIQAEWIQFAWDREDPTAILFNDNEPLYTPVVTY